MTVPVLGIVNPVAARGRSLRRWDRVLPALRDRFPGLTVCRTEGPGHAESIGREWARRHPEGAVIIGGGDGSVHEAVNGLVPAGWSGALGVVPIGTGNDFAVNAGFAGPGPGTGGRVDLGRIRFPGPDGAPRERLFLNAVSVGVSPFANRIAGSTKAWMPGRFAYAAAGVIALFRQGRRHLRVSHAGRVVLDGRVLNVTLANGPTFGGGMRISPESRIDDGRLDQVTIGSVGAIRALAALSRLYAGTHLRMRGVSSAPARGTVRIAEPGGPMLVEADGHDWITGGELQVECLPSALALLTWPAP